MATIHVGGESFSDPERVAEALAAVGVEYERWEASRPLASDATDAEILGAYADDVDRLKARGGYATADVMAVTPATPGLDAMLAKFASEHTHDDDEVRFVVAGRGLFYFPGPGGVFALEVAPGDLIRVPGGTRHWFTLCGDRTIRAIRLFRDPAGWVPRYTESGVDRGHEPVCLGESYVPRGTATS